MIHFFVDEGVDLTGLDEWDPDADPGRFADGVGHNLLELHRRLLVTGRTTTVGPDIPAGTTLVVAMHRVFPRTDLRTLIRYAMRVRRHRVLSIRSDFPEVLRSFVRLDVEVAPNQSFIEVHGNSSMVFMPPLPQRGLVVRDPARGDLLATATLKANPNNIPDGLRDPEVIASLARLGVRLVVDQPSRVDGSDQRWNDFSDIDVAICVRREDQVTRAKPATKLRNAWLAGVIPIASREPAYTEIATDRRDVMFIDHLDDVVEVVQELHDDAGLRSRLRSGVAAAAAELPTLDAMLDDWWALFSRNEDAPSTMRGIRSVMYLVDRQIRRVLGPYVRRARRRVGGA